MYFLNYVDRNAIAQARLNNLEDDLGMSGVEFNTCVSMSVACFCPAFLISRRRRLREGRSD
jgi:hypothetical protein